MFTNGFAQYFHSVIIMPGSEKKRTLDYCCHSLIRNAEIQKRPKIMVIEKEIKLVVEKPLELDQEIKEATPFQFPPGNSNRL